MTAMSTGVPPVPLPPGSSSTRLHAGELFASRFAVEAVLGEGGMGAVYRVLDRELDEVVALKLLRPEWAESQDALDRFRREVKLARRVTHPNVARTFDLGSVDGVRFLTMELIEGEPLSKRVGRGKRVPLGEALRVAGEVARGLTAAHTAGVVHRDLKPDNVMLGRDDERVVITDFGIARLAEGAVGNATRTIGSAIGTPAYMAPEQVEGRELDGRADIYALGIVLYEMLTGELPFVGETVYALAAARLAGTFPDPRTKVEDLPDGVVSLVRDALARRREDRPDAQVFLRRIQELRGIRVECLEPAMAAPMSTPITSSAVMSARPRTLAVLPPEGAGTPEANDLLQAIADALAGLRGLRVLPSSTVRAASANGGEATTVGRVLHADVVIEGSLRVAGARVRVRVRLVEVSSGTQLWSERWEGSTEDAFALEDDVVRGTVEAVRARLLDDAGRRGPADPEARDAYRRARQLYVAFGLPRVLEAVEVLRTAQASWPNDPWIKSALGAALARAWILGGGQDMAKIAEAEELSLRALAIDSSIGETYDTIGILRLQQGDTRAAVRAFQEAIARSPLLAEAHEYLGRLLCECGHPEEGMRRLDLAIRLEPNSVAAHWERARTFALLGDRERSEHGLARAITTAGMSTAQVTQRARLAMWWGDSEMARRLIDDMEKLTTPLPLVSEHMLPLLKAVVNNEPLGERAKWFDMLAANLTGSPRQRAFFHQLSVEFYSTAKMRAEALASLALAVELPLVDLLWLDRCPVLAELRDDPSFARSRAIVAARAAHAFS
jgi:TolB-like protein/Flp pilus assembly protein TadD